VKAGKRVDSLMVGCVVTSLDGIFVNEEDKAVKDMIRES